MGKFHSVSWFHLRVVNPFEEVGAIAKREGEFFFHTGTKIENLMACRKGKNHFFFLSTAANAAVTKVIKAPLLFLHITIKIHVAKVGTFRSVLVCTFMVVSGSRHFLLNP